jgi:WD40 repeat protein
MRNKKGYLLILSAVALCACVGFPAIRMTEIPSASAKEPSPSLFPAAPSPTFPFQEPTPASISWDRTNSSVLLMSRTSAGAIGYSLYDAQGKLVSEMEGPIPASGIGSVRESDIAPDGRHLAAASQKEYYEYEKTGGVCSDDMNAYVLELPAGKIQYTVPLLHSSKDLLAEIRNTVMEVRVQLAWDDYIYSLGSRDWSPDGTQLAFSAQSDGVTTAVRVLDLPTGSVKTVVEKPMVFFSLQWSPDGQWILAQEFEIGTYLDADWHAYSADGKQNVPIPDNGEHVEWLDSHTIVHVFGEFNPHIRLFDIFSKEDRLLFNNRIERFAISKEARFAVLSEFEESGTINVWYCPFDGPANILLDSIVIPEDKYLIELFAVAPNRVFLEFDMVGSGLNPLRPVMDIWMYSPGSAKKLIGENISVCAISPDGRTFAFYPFDENSLVIQNDNQDVKKWLSEEPILMLWDPRSEFLLSQTAYEITIIRFDSDLTNTITLPPGGTEYIAYWVK